MAVATGAMPSSEYDWLHGAWLLVSCTVTLADGSIILPYGDRPCGAILYTHDGWMACQMAADDSAGMPGSQSSSYHGRYDVDLSRNVIVHRVRWSSTPNVSGDAERHFRVEGQQLILSARSDGAAVEVTWTRGRSIPEGSKPG